MAIGYSARSIGVRRALVRKAHIFSIWVAASRLPVITMPKPYRQDMR